MNNTLKVSLMTLMSLLFCLNISASDLETISYKGQIQDHVNLETTKMVTLYRDEQRDSTCHRKEPYTVNECGNETRYREVCRFEPGHNRCWNETNRVCNYETRYRRVCSSSPSRRVCTTKPGHRDCRVVNGRQVCSRRPDRQVCRNVPGRQTCRQEPYQDRVCRNVTRNRCTWVPGRNICQQVPYEQRVCRDVVKYRSIPYACKVTVKVPYQAQKTIKHTVKVNYTGSLEIGNAELNFGIGKDNGLKVTGTNLNKSGSYITFNKSVVSQTDEFTTSSDVNIEFHNREEIQTVVKSKTHKLWMNKGGEFALTMDKLESKDYALDILVIYKGRRHFHSKIAVSEFDLESVSSQRTTLKIDLAKQGFERIKTLIGTGAKLEVRVGIHAKKVDFSRGVIDSFKGDSFAKEHKFKLKVYKTK